MFYDNFNLKMYTFVAMPINSFETITTSVCCAHAEFAKGFS